MNIEFNQGRQNEAITGAANVSASNDPVQQRNDVNKMLQDGAAVAGAMRTMGMSEEEALQFQSRKLRREQGLDDPAEERRRVEANQDSLVTRLIQEKTGKNLETIDSQRGYKSIDDNEQTEEQRFQGLTDIEGGLRTEEGEQYRDGRYVSEGTSYDPRTSDTAQVDLRKRDAQGIMRGHRLPSGELHTRKDFVRPEEGRAITQNALATSLVGREGKKRAGNIPIGAGNDVAPTSVLKDALARLEGGMAEGVQGPAAPPQMIAKIKQRLEEAANPGAAKARERQRVVEMIKADAAMSDPEVRQQNDAKAESEALQIMRSAGVPGAEEYTDVGGLGAVKMRGPAGQITAAPQDPRNMPVAIQDGGVTVVDDGRGGLKVAREMSYVDPRTGQNLTYDGEKNARDGYYFSEANKANTSQAINAPAVQNTAQWVSQHVPEYRESSSNFGDLPQTDIALSTTNFAQKVRELRGFGTEDVNINLRGTQDLDDMVRAVYAGAAAKGKQLFVKDDAGNNTPAAYGDPSGVMNLFKMSKGEQSDLAGALFQMDMSGSERPRESRENRGIIPGENVVMGAEVDGRGSGRMSTVPKNSTIVTGTDENGKPIRTNIRAALNALEGGPDVTKPIIGALIDPSTGKQETAAGPGYLSRFKPKNMGSGEELESNLRRQAISRVKGGQKLDKEKLRQTTTKARLVEEREARDSRNRAEMRDTITNRGRFITSEPIPGNLPARAAEDAEFEARAAKIQSRDANAEIERIANGRRNSAPAGALVSLREPAKQTEPSTQYYDGSSKYDVASNMAAREPGIKKKAAQRKDIAARLEREIVGRAMRGQRERRNLGIGALAAGGAALAGKGIYDVTRPEEEDSSLMVRYS